jgi:acyl-CoA thioesterase FadM
MYDIVTVINNTTYLKFAKRAYLKLFQHTHMGNYVICD